MDTPGARSGPTPTLYGCSSRGINRRLVVTGGLLLPFVAAAKPARQEIKAIAWTGTAHASVQDRELDLVVSTRIELPLLFVRSTSRIASDGPEKARTLVLEPADGWVEFAGNRRPLPIDMAIHERQQYAIYAWLLIAMSKSRKPRSTLALSEPPYPDIRFGIGPDGRPATAELTIDAPEAGKPRIRETLAFEGMVRDKHIRWPQTIKIFQDDKPYFTLKLDTFSVELA